MHVFWLLFLLLPFAGLAYVAWHVWVLLPLGTAGRTFAVSLGVLCFLTLILDFTGRLDTLPMSLARALYNIGTSSLIVMLYLAMLFLLMDIGRCCGVIPRSWLYSNWTTMGCILGLLLTVFVYGRIHYDNKVRVPLELKSDKPLPREYRVVMASDLHLGYHNGRRELARWVDMMNAEQPDLILIAGDIIDISLRPLVEENMAEELRRLEAPVYACLGNHEYYARTPKARQFYKDANIHLLIDEIVSLNLPIKGENSTITDSLQSKRTLVIIGRDDRTNPHRKSLADLMSSTDSLPLIEESERAFTILLDHQPHDLAEAERAGIDFQLSGHTHRGQVWPISWITDHIFECSWGFHRRGRTQYYVSSGLGIWGGRFRIGTQSEYVVATIH